LGGKNQIFFAGPYNPKKHLGRVRGVMQMMHDVPYFNYDVTALPSLQDLVETLPQQQPIKENREQSKPAF
jgi:hypothetical protein